MDSDDDMPPPLEDMTSHFEQMKITKKVEAPITAPFVYPVDANVSVIKPTYGDFPVT